MAMAARSAVSVLLLLLVAPLLLLSVLVSAASAARAVGDAVQDACSKTQFPKICADSLAAKPESQKATPRKLAELFVNIAAEKGSGMAALVQGKDKDKTLSKCYDSCSDDVEEAVAHLNGLVREPTDAKFLELKSWLSSTLGGTSTCEDACKDAPKGGDKDAVVSFSLDFEKLQRVTLDLITEASGSMSAGIALPPSDAGAPSYGAAAPSYGGGSVDAPSGGDSDGSGSGSGSGSSSDSGSEGPAASATSGPSSGGDTPAYGASASGPAAADAPSSSSSSGPSGAPAPKSSDSSSAPGPSSDDGSSSAPAPSSGDDGSS